MKVLAMIMKWLRIGKFAPICGYVFAFCLFIVSPVLILTSIITNFAELDNDGGFGLYFLFLSILLLAIYELKKRNRSVQHKLEHVGWLEYDAQLAVIRTHSYELSKGFAIAVKRNQFGRIISDKRFDVAFEFITSTDQEEFFAEFLPSEIVRYIEDALLRFEGNVHVQLYMPP